MAIDKNGFDWLVISLSMHVSKSLMKLNSEIQFYDAYLSEPTWFNYDKVIEEDLRPLILPLATDLASNILYVGLDYTVDRIGRSISRVIPEFPNKRMLSVPSPSRLWMLDKDVRTYIETLQENPSLGDNYSKLLS